MRRRKPPGERFWAKVNKTDSCWVWTGYRDRDGYGLFSSTPGGTVRAHRYAYELANGPLQCGLQLDHICHLAEECDLGTRCTHRACVRPDHLSPATHLENAARTKKKLQTQCAHGHEFTDENTHVRSNGTRQCRECHQQGEKAPEALKRRAEASRRFYLKHGEKRSPEALARRKEQARARYRRNRDLMGGNLCRVEREDA